MLLDSGVSYFPLAVGGGSSVIEVEEFPTENVQDLTFYKSTNETPTKIAISFNYQLIEFGGDVFVVEEFPNEPNIYDFDTGYGSVYVLNDLPYVFVDMGEGVQPITIGQLMSYEIPITDKGPIGSIEEIKEDGVYIIYGKKQEIMGVNGSTYNYIDGFWTNNNDNILNLLNGNIVSYYSKTLKSLRNYAFCGCEYLETVDLPNVTILGNSSFEYCYLLKNINFPLVRMVNTSVFRECNSLVNVILPEAIEIGSLCFYSCDNLQVVTLPKVEKIYGSAFMDCFALTDLYLGSFELVTLDSNCFYDNPNTKVHVRAELLSEYQADTNWAEAVTKGYITLVGDYTD